MEDYFKDFEFFGFATELEMAEIISKEYSDKNRYSDDFRNKTFKELVEHWIDERADSFGLESVSNKIKIKDKHSIVWIGHKFFKKPGIYTKS